MKEKIKVNMLPCYSKSMKLWFESTIAAVLLSGIIFALAIFSMITSDNIMLPLTIIIVAVIPSLFFMEFAKSSRVLRHGLSTLTYISTAAWSIGVLILLYMILREVFSDLSEKEEMRILIGIGVCLLICMVISIITGIKIKVNYDGMIAKLGTAFILLPIIAILSIGIAVAARKFPYFIIVPAYLIGYVLVPMYKLMNAGLSLAQDNEEAEKLFKSDNIVITENEGETYFEYGSETSETDGNKRENNNQQIKKNKNLKDSSNSLGDRLDKLRTSLKSRAGRIQVSSKAVKKGLIILLGLVILGGAGYTIYENQKLNTQRKNRKEFQELSDKYQPDFTVEGKFDGKHNDVLAIFPVESTAFNNKNGEKVYGKVVIKSERGTLPDLELKPEDIGFSEENGINYDDPATIYIKSFEEVFGKGKERQVGFLVDLGGWHRFMEGSVFYLKNGKWIKDEQLVEKWNNSYYEE